jgi:hypothetical protein
MSCADGRHRSPRAIEDEERSQARSMGFLYNGGTSRSLSFTSRTGACIRCLFNEHRASAMKVELPGESKPFADIEEANVSRSPASRSLQSV